MPLSQGTLGYYARLSDKQDRGPQLYGGDARIAALRAFRRYHKDARVDMVRQDGRTRWMGQKMSAVYAILHRQGSSGEGLLTEKAIAAEAGCSAGYVSKVIVRLQAWGWFWIVSVRGRNGGLWVVLRTAGDGLDHWARSAWEKLKAAKQRLLSRLAIKVSSTTHEGVEQQAVAVNGDPLGCYYHYLT